MAAFTFFDEFAGDVGSAIHNFGSHSFKVAFSNTAPAQATNAVLADITEISAGGGYSAGGVLLDSTAWAETGAGTGVWFFDSANEIFTASGAAVGPFQYLVLYNDTSTGDRLVGYLDLGTGVTVPDGETFTIELGANGWFTLPIT